MAKQQSKKAFLTESREVGSHKIEYRKAGQFEEIEIDGVVVPFFRVGKRYQIELAAYENPHDSLLDAAESYAKNHLA